MEGLDNSATLAAPVIPPGVSLEGDDLTTIKGIGANIAGQLRAAGITTFRQLAELNIADCERLEEETGLKGRIVNFHWRDQARKIIAEPPRQRPSRAAGAIEEPQENGELEEPEDAPADPLARQIEDMRRQLEALNAQMVRSGRKAPTLARHVRSTPLAAEGKQRRQLNKNRKYSFIMGSDPDIPHGSIFSQVVTENNEKRVAYFANDLIQRFMGDVSVDDIDLDNVEPPHEATVETVHARNYLNGLVEYPLSLMIAFMKERFSFEARSKKEIQEELHRMINTNRS